MNASGHFCVGGYIVLSGALCRTNSSQTFISNCLGKRKGSDEKFHFYIGCSFVTLSQHPFRTDKKKLTASQSERLQFLDERICSTRMGVVISLDNRENNSLKHMLKKYKIRHELFFIMDYTEITVEQHNEFYKMFGAEFKHDTNIFIHCGSGFGRTSVIVAGLLLRELFEKNQQTFFDDNQSLNNQIDLVGEIDGIVRTVNCYFSVRNVVENIRTTFDIRAIEKKDDVLSLNALCEFFCNTYGGD